MRFIVNLSQISADMEAMPGYSTFGISRLRPMLGKLGLTGTERALDHTTAFPKRDVRVLKMRASAEVRGFHRIIQCVKR